MGVPFGSHQNNPTMGMAGMALKKTHPRAVQRQIHIQIVMKLQVFWGPCPQESSGPENELSSPNPNRIASIVVGTYKQLLGTWAVASGSGCGGSFGS